MEKYFIAFAIIIIIIVVYLITRKPKAPIDDNPIPKPDVIDLKLLELQSKLKDLTLEKESLEQELNIYDSNFETYDKLIIDIKEKQDDKYNLENIVLPDLNKNITQYNIDVESLQTQLNKHNQELLDKTEQVRLMNLNIIGVNAQIEQVKIDIDTKSKERQAELDPIIDSVRLLGINVKVIEDELAVKIEINNNLNGLINAELEKIRLVLIEEEAKLNLNITDATFGAMHAIYYDDIKDKSIYKSLSNTISPYYEYDSKQFYSLLGSIVLPTDINLIGIELGLIFSNNGVYSYDANNPNRDDFGIITLKNSKNENIDTYKISNKYALINKLISSDQYGAECHIVAQWMSKDSTKYIAGLPDFSIIAYYN
jgi:hypothetical protein